MSESQFSSACIGMHQIFPQSYSCWTAIPWRQYSHLKH